MDNKVDLYFENLTHWGEELRKLREIIKNLELKEEYKWGGPVYTYKGKNVVGMRGFKEHLAIWFYNGVFLKDEDNLLMSSGENTQSLRQMRFKSLDEVKKSKKIIARYISEAIEVERAGLRIPSQRITTFDIPAELENVLRSSEKLKSAFEDLTPGRQKEYALYIAEAKQEKTRLSRLEKCIPLIGKGLGLNDRYRNC